MYSYREQRWWEARDARMDVQVRHLHSARPSDLSSAIQGNFCEPKKYIFQIFPTKCTEGTEKGWLDKAPN